MVQVFYNKDICYIWMELVGLLTDLKTKIYRVEYLKGKDKWVILINQKKEKDSILGITKTIINCM